MARMRVHELARELGVTSKQLLATLADLGESVRSASSAIDEQVQERLRAAHASDTPDTPAPAADETAGDVSVAGDPPVAEPAAGEPSAVPSVSFVSPSETDAPAAVESPAPGRRRRAASAPAGPPEAAPDEPDSGDTSIAAAEDAADGTAEPDDVRETAAEEASGARRRRRRGRRGRGGTKPSDAGPSDTGPSDAGDSASGDDAGAVEGQPAEAEHAGDDVQAGKRAEKATAESSEDTSGDSPAEGSSTNRRRRRRRRSGGGNGDASDSGNGKDGDAADEVKGVKGSTRLEAKRQRRRDGRDSGRKRPPILTEAEFLARRESVDRVMAVRQTGERTQIAVLEDDVLVEHYVTRASATSYVGNVYLGRVQNVLPSMEAAFVDIGKGRNGVLYAGEVNWDAAGLEGKARAIENAMNSGDTVLVQVTKDPIGHKGARLTSQISLPGRFLVYVPGGGITGISRKLPDTERHRLKAILKKIVPDEAGVIIRTAAEGASEDELRRDVERLQAQWEQIEANSAKAKSAKAPSAPKLLHGEPDLAIRVVRDVFNEDFRKLIVSGGGAWETVSDYIAGVAPDLADRVSRHTAETDLFHDLRVDEQLAKALDRKVWLPSGGSLIIDRTEAMTVIDVNTGKFVGSGGNLEQTVTRNNLEAAEEIVRQLRLRDVGGIVVIDFIDMVLESNRELVLRRLTECLGRDRTRHQVAEVTSLGLVQMTRKRVGEGLLQAFSEPCEACRGRGVIVHSDPVDSEAGGNDDGDKPKSKRRRGGKKTEQQAESEAPEHREKRMAAMAAIHRAAHPDDEDGAEGEIPLEHVAMAEQVTADGPVDGAQPAAPPAPETEPADETEPAHPSGSRDEGHGPETPSISGDGRTAPARPRRRRGASRPAGPPQPVGS